MLVVLAAQLSLVEHHEVTDAVMVWKADRSRTLGDILAQKGLLSARDRQLLEPMIDRQIEIHGGSAVQSLGSMPAAEPLRDLLGLEELDADQEATSATGMMTSDAALPETMPFSRVTTPGDRFQILRLHAEGGLGRVSVALDRELNREVAFKEIRDKFAGDERTRTRFVTEAVLTGGLEHPGIVPVYSLGEFEDGRPYYAMRLIRGDSLPKAIARHHRAHAESGKSSDSA